MDRNNNNTTNVENKLPIIHEPEFYYNEVNGIPIIIFSKNTNKHITENKQVYSPRITSNFNK